MFLNPMSINNWKFPLALCLAKEKFNVHRPIIKIKINSVFYANFKIQPYQDMPTGILTRTACGLRKFVTIIK